MHTPLHEQDVTQGQFLIFLKQFNWFQIQNFPSLKPIGIPSLKSPHCPTNLPIAGGRIVGFIFPRGINTI